MSKNLFKHYIALLLAVVMIFAMLPINALAASGVNSHGVPGLTASYSGGEGWESSTGCISGMVKANHSSGCTGDSYKPLNAKLTLTNTSGTTALLSFDYAIVLSGGSILINGEAVVSGGSFSKKLENNENIEVSMTSNAANEEYTKIAISSLQLAPEQTVSITFIAPTNGSYTVDGTAITTETTITKLNTETFSLAATPASGYKLMGWKYIDSGEYFSSDLTLTTSFSEDHSVCPEFVPSTTPVFQVGKALFTDLNEAVEYSQSSNTAKIALISNGTLPAGNYTIPNGKTLVIPFDEAQTVYTTAPGMTLGSDGKPAAHVNPSAFRTLTMASGAKITVASGGALCVPSMVSAVGTNSGSWNATPTGKHGRITMNSGSIIDVQSGGKLYAWGYVAGSGNIYARSGSEVWECFQVRCWRGGTATSGMAGNSQKVFPLNQYYVQNIEAPITFYPGAKETVFAAVNMSNQQFGASATFVGSSGMFRLTSGTMTKRFTGTTDRLELTVDGDFTVSPMALSISGLPLVGTLDLDTNDYVLPITNNITIRVNSGNTTFNQDVAFLPGTEMIIANGATVKIASGHKAYVYDQDQWGQYAAGGAQLVVVGYSTVNGTTAKRTAASLIDSKIDVNGTLTVEGQLYTTENGAAIISTEGTGVYNQTADPGIDENTYQATQSGSDITYVSIPITAAKLQNEDGSYVETSDKTAGAVIPYVNGVWGGSPAAEHTLTINYVVPEGFTAPAQYSGTFTEGEEYSVTSPNVEGCTPDTAVVTGTMGNEDVTVTVTYSVNKYTITWKNEDGTVLETDENVPYNSTPEYNGATPVKDSDDTNHYTFTGWDPGIVPVTGPATYTAVFTAEPHTYGTPSWTWTGYTAATATFTCSECGHTHPVTATITSVTTDPTCTSDGETVYTATVTFNGQNYTDIKTEVLSATGHTWGAPTYVWADDNSTVTATRVCANDPTHVETETANTSYVVTTPATCENVGVGTYTATFNNPAFTTQTKEVEIPATGHTWGDPTYVWADDNSTVTATRVCANDPTHVETETANTSYVVTTPATCENVGVGTYTATFSNPAFATQTKEVEIPATGHNWDLDNPVWGVPTGIIFPTVTITFTCTVCGETTQITAETVGFVTEQDASCVEGGYKEATFEASFGGRTFEKTIRWDEEPADPTLHPFDLEEHGAVAATCTEEGNSAYWYCPVCEKYFSDADGLNEIEENSWIIPATGHSWGEPTWNWADDHSSATATFTCSVCGYSQTVTAQITSDTTPATPTQPGSIVYTATVEFNGNTYTNVETETLTYTGWKIDENGKTYIIDGEIAYHNQWQTIEDATYWFDDAGYVLDCGIYWLPYPEGYGPDQWNIDNSNQPYTNAGYLTNSFFSIDANGKLEKDANGFRTLPEGTVVHCKEDDETLTESFEIWLVNGEMPWHPGLVTDDTDYYYFPTGYFDAKRAKISGTNYYISKTNELEWPDIWGEGVFSTGLYTFDNEGKLQLLDGLIDKEDKTYYYDHGMLTYAGVIKIGDYFYYVKSDYTIVKDATYYVIAEKTNGLTGAGLHGFDNYGHMFLPNGDPHFTGIIKVDDDNWFYYEDGVKSYAGLIEIDGHLYYVNSQFKVIHNADYPICKTNGLKPQGTYYFDENGWLEEINETLNGIVKEGDKWYYYVDGIKTYAGVFKIGNDFYYAKSDGEVIHGRSYYISKTNGLVEKGQYDFDEEGRMFMYNGIYKNDNGIWIYYVNGVKTYAGVILIDGSYYYVKSDFQVVHDRSYVVNKTNNLVSPGTYQFDAEGHMIIN